MLKWAHKNNCPWSGFTILHAAFQNHLDILKWARQQQISCPWWSLDELGYLDIVDLIAAKPSTLLWLAQQGAPLPDEAYAIACSSAKWLTHAHIALRVLLPADVLNHILTLSIK